MTPQKLAIWMMVLVAQLLCSPAAQAAERSGAPYFSVVGSETERLPLTLTTVDATIAGVIADVALKQTYENRGTRPIEAIYVFPASANAAVYALTMTIGERVIRAKIRDKQQAREEYDAAREQGKTASLLEQLDPSVFRMNVANVLPGDKIQVELRYTELLIPEQGVYEFFVPNTMGQRYGSDSSPGVGTPTSSASEVVDYSFDVHTQLRSALPLASVESPSHAVEVSRASAYEADVRFAESAIEKASASDYVLRYTLAGEQIQSGILAYPEGDGGYFLLLAEPPKTVPASAIAPREFIFVIDVSGSMIGAPLDLTKSLIGDLFSTLRPTDRFNVVLFSGGSRVLSAKSSLPATPETLERVRAMVSNENAGGGTELVPALETAYALPETTGMARSIVIVTDGQIWAGGEAYRAIRSKLGRANAFAFGVGPSVDREVIARLARAGAGEPFIVAKMDDGQDVAGRMRQYIDRPLLTHVELGLDGFAANELEPSAVPDLLAERPIVIVGRYSGAAQGAIVVRGYSGSAPYEQRVAVDARYVSPQLSALRQLWARARVQRLLDEQAVSGYWGQASEDAIDHTKAITALGLEYNLLTPYTSFVAIDELVRTSEAAVSVDQPSVAKPAAVPQPISYSSGTGSALTFTHAVGALSGAYLKPAPAATGVRTIGTRRFDLIAGTWTDADYRDGLHTVRVRRDSAAFERLLQLAPALREALALGERVLIVCGDYALLIGPEGFSDYPDRVLKRALGMRG